MNHFAEANSKNRESANNRAEILHLLYHELSAIPADYSYIVQAQAFAEQLDLFRRLQNGMPLQPAITFDDGHLSNYEIAFPLLQERRMKATFFITAGWIGSREGYMGWNELRALQEAGHTIGAHGMTHRLLTHCDSNELRTELYSSKEMLQDKLGASINKLSFPGGRCNQRVLKACDNAGYTRMYSSVPRPEPIPLGHVIGRLNVRGDWSLGWMTELFNDDRAVLNKLRRQDKFKSVAKSVLGDTLYAKLWAVLNRRDPESDLVRNIHS